MLYSELVPTKEEEHKSYGLTSNENSVNINLLSLFNDHIPNRSISKALTSAWPIVDYDECCSLSARFNYHSTFVAVDPTVR